VPQLEAQGLQQFEGLKALIVSGSLDAAMLPVLPGLPEAAAETLRALVAASPKHVETLIAEQQAVQAIHSELAAAKITSLGDFPLLVLSHGQPMLMPGLTDAVNQANEQLWQQLQAGCHRRDGWALPKTAATTSSWSGRSWWSTPAPRSWQLPEPAQVIQPSGPALTRRDSVGRPSPARDHDRVRPLPGLDPAGPDRAAAGLHHPGRLQPARPAGAAHPHRGGGERLEPMDSDTPVKLTPAPPSTRSPTRTS
jgi:hypothetical protein